MYYSGHLVSSAITFLESGSLNLLFLLLLFCAILFLCWHIKNILGKKSLGYLLFQAKSNSFMRLLLLKAGRWGSLVYISSEWVHGTWLPAGFKQWQPSLLQLRCSLVLSLLSTRTPMSLGHPTSDRLPGGKGAIYHDLLCIVCQAFRPRHRPLSRK